MIDKGVEESHGRGQQKERWQENNKTKTKRGSRRESRGGAGRKRRQVLHVLVFGLLPSEDGSLRIPAGLAERSFVMPRS